MAQWMNEWMNEWMSDGTILFKKDSCEVKNPQHIKRDDFIVYSPRHIKIGPASFRKIDREIVVFYPKIQIVLLNGVLLKYLMGNITYGLKY